MGAVTLMGRGASWKECTFPTSELWGVESCLLTDELKDKNFTKIFAFDSGDTKPMQEALSVARMRNIPIVSIREYATEPFPMTAIAREFWSSYFMPSMSYMIAYALYQKYERIFIYGIDQGPRWDYQQGKAHILFWLGVATGRKVDLRLGRGSLRWAYRLGFNELPEIFFIDEATGIVNHLGLIIRSQEIKSDNEYAQELEALKVS